MTTAAAGNPSLERKKDGDLESLVYLEEMFQQYGYDDGFRDGQESGELEGRIFGCEKSFELGLEIGFYEGCAKTWRALAKAHPDRVPNKASKHLEALERMIDEFPKDNCPNTDMYGARDKMKAKMKLISTLLGIQQKFNMQMPSTMIY
ncbi:oral cancer-overexpressed protein 1 [Dichotomocladium elegans]|nr:oral cancer-overexpressed protein 1 [Dichotomocladium elegans]